MTEAAGATVEVEISVSKSPEQMWDLVTDVERIGEWSPECTGGRWLGDRAPELGARFEGDNEFSASFRSTTVCVVLEASAPEAFEYIVLDPAGDPERYGSLWRYQLRPGNAPGTTIVSQRFIHGPGMTGLTRGMADNPAEAGQILAGRLEAIGKNMTITHQRMGTS